MDERPHTGLGAAVASVLILLAGPAAAAPPGCSFTIDQVPATITAPGTYCLAADLTYAGDGAAISIDADVVALDLNGFTLAGQTGPGSQSIGVQSAGVDGVTVRNGVVTGFRQGVLLKGGTGHLVDRVRAEGNSYVGLLALGSSSTIQNCEVVSTGGSTLPGDTIPIAIRVSGDNVLVADNVVTDTFPPPGGEAVGIALDEGTGTQVDRNVIANAMLAPDPTWGIWSLVTSVEASDNLIIRYQYGMAFTAPSSGVYASNTFFNVAMPVALGTPDMIDGGNSVVHAFCEPIYALPYVISQQGSYCLVRNLSTAITSGDAISIAASDVSLDLRGFKVGGGTAGPGSQAVGIHAVDRRNVTVANGNVRGFGQAVFLEDTSPGLSAAGPYRVERILADGNTSIGIHVQGRSGLVRHNQVVETTGTGGGPGANSYGIRVEGPLARVLDNEVSGTASAGGTAYSAAVSGGRGAVVDRNRISAAPGGASVGIFLSSTLDALVTGNRIIGTGTGLSFSGSSSGRYRDNVTAGVATPYFGGTDAGHNN
ncbi:MAG TPA: right-handed parallel beta-helix repeat-containing protein [Gemmatimonadales bacterium]|nr:right-handed parallel beta-helix repeat-containing protein [Gemmatimonadales bacterium]